MPPSTPRILVDDRERSAGLAASLRRLIPGPVETARLDVGDVWIGDRLVLERKDAADFVASLLDGRLERQLHALASLGAQRAAIIIEGEFNTQTLAGMAGREVRAAMLAIQFDWRIPLIRANSIEDTARWITDLVRRESGQAAPLAPGLLPSPALRPHPAGHRKTNGNHVGQLKTAPETALAAIPGLGPTRARALIQTLGSMQAILAASEDQLAQTPGIGPVLAREIKKRFPGH